MYFLVWKEGKVWPRDLQNILVVLGLVPGMPHVAFIALGAITYGLAFLLTRSATAAGAAQAPPPAAPAPPKELDWSDIEQVDLIALEIGYALIPLVNQDAGGQLMSRVKGIRKKLSAELGFLVPTVRIRDVLTLEPNTYNICINEIGRAHV